MKYRPVLPKDGWYTYGMFIAGIPFYIGKGSGYRALNHFSPSLRKDRSWKTSMINKYEDLIEVIILSTHSCEKEAFDTEEFLIRQYGRRTEGGLLVNLTDGGGGVSGTIVTEEAKQKRARSRLRFDPDLFREALKSYYLDGMSQSEVCEFYKITQTKFSRAIRGKTQTLTSVLNEFKSENPEIDFENYSISKMFGRTNN